MSALAKPPTHRQDFTLVRFGRLYRPTRRVPVWTLLIITVGSAALSLPTACNLEQIAALHGIGEMRFDLPPCQKFETAFWKDEHTLWYTTRHARPGEPREEHEYQSSIAPPGILHALVPAFQLVCWTLATVLGDRPTGLGVPKFRQCTAHCFRCLLMVDD